MAKHHPDLIFCRKQPGVGKCSIYLFIVLYYLYTFVLFTYFTSTTAIGRLCEKCDGKCVICDSYVRPCTLVRICDECNYGSYQGRCVICGGPGVSDAYYCKECTVQEKDVSYILNCLISFINQVHKVFIISERWMSKNCKFGKFKNRSILRTEKIWIQTALEALYFYLYFVLCIFLFIISY